MAYTAGRGSRAHCFSRFCSAGSPSRSSVAAAWSRSVASVCFVAATYCAAAARWRSQIAVDTATTVVTCASIRKRKNFQNSRPNGYSLTSW